MARDEKHLHPLVAEKWRRLAGAAALLGHPIFITCTLRTASEQAALYDQGRTRDGAIVTHAQAWQSWHQPWLRHGDAWRCLAFDVAFRPEDNPGGATWDGPWDMIGLMGEAVGLEWGGRWRGRKRDRPHFQDPLGHTLAELRAARGAEIGVV
jgi:peptidoglycan L-alanyl-D-glutamate endopeptidase CwlK